MKPNGSGLRTCISIAVSRHNGRGGLDDLPGTLTASSSFAAWARAASFDAIETADDSAPDSEVSVELLRRKFLKLVANTEQKVDHLVIHFAGHGFSDQFDDQLLLLSRWDQPEEAISLRRLAALLQFYQVNRVSFFLDACRSLKPENAWHLQGSGILPVQKEEQEEFLEDRFRPSRAGQQAFMIRDLLGGAHQCLFTTVLLNALSGQYQEAIEKRGARNVITSDGLYRALRVHLPEQANRYKLSLIPSLKPGFVPVDDVYVELPIKFSPPVLPAPIFANFETSPIAKTDAPSDTLKQVQERLRGVYLQPVHWHSLSTLQKDETGIRVIGDKNYGYVFSKGSVQEYGRDLFIPLSGTGSGSIAVTNPNSRLVVGLAKVPFAVATINFPNQKDSEAPIEANFPSVVYQSTQPELQQNAVENLVVSTEILARLLSGKLLGNEALSIASTLRDMKHANPILGIIAAYLYDAVGDKDNVRRIAWFYWHNKQPIPFDIALLADLRGERGEDGLISVDLPAVPERKPRTDEQSNNPWYFRETYAQAGAAVAGGFPWMRPGWKLLDIARLPVNQKLLALSDQVLPYAFTTFQEKAGRILADLVHDGEV
jgi:hypothetical protein